MEISEEKLESFVRDLQELNNSIENEIVARADRIIALKGDIYLIEKMLSELAVIAKQGPPGQSSPPPGPPRSGPAQDPDRSTRETPRINHG